MRQNNLCPIRSLEERNRLIESHLHLVRKIAALASRKFPPSIDLDDLVGDGMLGLIQAAQQYQVIQKPGFKQPVPFRSYASRKIWSAILDANRRRHFRNATHASMEEIAEPSSPPQIECDIDLRRRASAVHQAVAGLSSTQRGAVLAFCRRDGRGQLGGEARVALRNGLALQGLRKAA